MHIFQITWADNAALKVDSIARLRGLLSTGEHFRYLQVSAGGAFLIDA